MHIFKKAFVFLLAFVIVFYSTDVAFCASTDLKIKPKIITERGYSDAAVTGKYDIELLTEDSYNQAEEIIQNRMLEYEKMQADLFTDEKEKVSDNNISAIISDLGLFKKGYAAIERDTGVDEKGLNIFLSVLVILAGIGIGIVLSIVFQKRKVEQNQ